MDQEGVMKKITQQLIYAIQVCCFLPGDSANSLLWSGTEEDQAIRKGLSVLSFSGNQYKWNL